LFHIHIEFDILINLVRLRDMCLTKTYSGDRVGNHWSDVFPIKNCLKKGDNLSTLL